MSAKKATFRVRLISGSRITIPSAIRKLLGLRYGDYVVCDVRAVETEEPPSLKTLWQILRTCRKELTRDEIAKRCRLSAPTSRSCLYLLVTEELLSVSNAGESKAGDETYRTTEKGLQIVNLIAPTRGSSQ